MQLRRRARILGGALAVVVAAGTTVAGDADAVAGFGLGRLAGGDRYATAATVAMDTFGAADEAVVASGDNFPDALAGNYLAGRRRAPVLLAQRHLVPGWTMLALERLGVDRVTLLGGEAALGPEVVASLTGAGMTVVRIAGADRFETAAAVARAGGPPPSGTALVGSGRSFADALAAGPVAYGSALPQLLTEPGSLSSAVVRAVADLRLHSVVVLGGTGAVGPAVEAQLRGLGLQVARIAGGDRYATSVAIAEWAIGALGHRRDHVDVATGATFPDALAGGAHAGASRATVLLVEPNAVGGAAARYLLGHVATVVGGHALGGAAAISDASLAALVDAGRGIAPPPPPPPPPPPALCETTLVTLLNVERGLAGLPPFSVSQAAGPIARSWSAHMAAVGGMSHNPDVGAQLDAAGIPWRAWAENVGYGGSAADVHALLMGSAPHRANILAAGLTHVAVGCTVDGSGLHWITQVFFRT